MSEIKVRYNIVAGVSALLVGALLAVTGISGRDTITVIPGVVVVVLGILYCVGTAAIVRPHQVEVKNPLQITLKRVPIQGLGDLRLDGMELRRVGDDKKIVNMGWGMCRAGDVEVLRQAIAGAHAAPQPGMPPPGMRPPPQG